jgi:hypothetical protein
MAVDFSTLQLSFRQDSSVASNGKHVSDLCRVLSKFGLQKLEFVDVIKNRYEVIDSEIEGFPKLTAVEIMHRAKLEEIIHNLEKKEDGGSSWITWTLDPR